MPRNPYDVREVGFCAGCTLEIYPGDDILGFDSQIVHDDIECLKQAIGAKRITTDAYLQDQFLKAV